MVAHVRLNLEEIEAMLYFWHATAEREKVSESYLNQVANMPGISLTYDDEFTQESVRKVLSAITNRERLSNMTKKEARFWSNNMWMLEDLGYTDEIVKPLKLLNLDDLPEQLNQQAFDITNLELEVIITPLHFNDYLVVGHRLIINFFKITPGDEGLFIGGVPLKEYITTCLAKIPTT